MDHAEASPDEKPACVRPGLDIRAGATSVVLRTVVYWGPSSFSRQQVCRRVAVEHSQFEAEAPSRTSTSKELSPDGGSRQYRLDTGRRHPVQEDGHPKQVPKVHVRKPSRQRPASSAHIIIRAGRESVSYTPSFSSTSPGRRTRRPTMPSCRARPSIFSAPRLISSRMPCERISRNHGE